MEAKEIILGNLPSSVSKEISDISFSDIEEIRLRAGRRLAVYSAGRYTCSGIS
jgi:stage III sporulation protein SpoIIIAA